MFLSSENIFYQPDKIGYRDGFFYVSFTLTNEGPALNRISSLRYADIKNTFTSGFISLTFSINWYPSVTGILISETMIPSTVKSWYANLVLGVADLSKAVSSPAAFNNVKIYCHIISLFSHQLSHVSYLFGTIWNVYRHFVGIYRSPTWLISEGTSVCHGGV